MSGVWDFPNSKDTGCPEFRNKYFSPFLLEIPEFLANFAVYHKLKCKYMKHIKLSIMRIYLSLCYVKRFLSQWSIYCMTSIKEHVIYYSGLRVFITGCLRPEEYCQEIF